MATAQPAGPSPELIFETLNAYQRSAALRAAIELDLFQAIGEGPGDVASLARRCKRHAGAAAFSTPPLVGPQRAAHDDRLAEPRLAATLIDQVGDPATLEVRQAAERML